MQTRPQQPEVIKATEFLRAYAAFDPTCINRFYRRPDTESFDGLKVVQRVKSAPRARGSNCFFVREQAERFLEARRRELETPRLTIVRDFDQRNAVQLMRDKGFVEVAASLARYKPRKKTA